MSYAVAFFALWGVLHFCGSTLRHVLHWRHRRRAYRLRVATGDRWRAIKTCANDPNAVAINLGDGIVWSRQQCLAWVREMEG